MEALINSPLMIFLAGLISVMGFIRATKKDADDDLAPEKVKALSDYLIGATQMKAGTWIPDFVYVFDRFFHYKNSESSRCLVLSTFISVGSFFLISTLLSLNSNAEWYAMLFLAVLFNAPIDYICLLTTRKFLDSSLPIPILIAVNATTTFFLAHLWVLSTFLLLDGGFVHPYVFFNIAVEHFSTSLDWLNGDLRNGDIFIFTSFTTSIWLWLYGLSYYTLKLLTSIQLIIKTLTRFCSFSHLTIRLHPIIQISQHEI
ncbi:MAG: hypothetical protein ACR2PX_28570 [Endozoicomonas sp.]|uniref:hypothetical protein n=1 Tax=Endozoicomonas sp. TaxID=1892382 RepID=UPI003D9B9829